ncbi:MAG TPA: N-acetylmuramoyl-L-alanine amidase [Ignavibacteria bacterium]|nr:N-acetylmuramoyl-L-alanine amidase [Ignavibacteria bacterium]
MYKIKSSDDLKKIILILSLLAISSTAIIFTNKTSTSQSASDKRIYTVIIDPGHGGKDPGTTGLSGVYEKNIVLPIGIKLKNYLSKEYDDMKIVMTREKDEFIELKKRGQTANEQGGNLFVSIHCNARKSEENDKSGFEIYLLDLARIDEARDITLEENKFIAFNEKIDSSFISKNKILASLYQQAYLGYSERFSSIIETELIKGTRLPSRGLFQAGFWVLLAPSMPSILVECGYLSNKTDEEYLKSEKGQDEIAKSIFKAVRYFKMDYDFENSLMD